MLKSTVYTLIVSTLIAILSIAGYLYSVVYVGGMGSDLNDLYKKSEDLKKEEESLNSIKRVAQNAGQKSAELSRYIVGVENEGSINFVRTIEDTADKYGLQYNTNSIEIVPDDNLSKINKEYLSVKETVSGPASSVSEYVKKIDTLPFNTKIKNYSITNITGLSGKGVGPTQQLNLEILVVKEK